MEWAYRFAREPRRLGRRYTVGNAAFVARAVASAGRDARGVAVRGRRALNALVAGGALVALSPVCAAVALAIKLDSKGPVLFRQTRIGIKGAPFTVLKFRTMHTDAEARRAALLAHSDREGICFKKRDDPRVTRVGRILRRFSIDEVPQLVNVLKGDMAVVGPRPALPEEVANYPAEALERLDVRPGLTGLWQVAGRASVGFSKMIDMDRAYARSRSLFLDVALMVLTARAVLTGRGAV
jgi:lipopolysaccharide/colanic/teichoic acid biosynthesis glycosyltransferase